MRRQRYDGEGRKRAIVETAMPIFARKGFAGTTTKELAKAARVSEALLYKHFPSKKALYQEILDCGPQTTDMAFRRLETMTPSTETLIYFAHVAVWRFVAKHDSAAAERIQNMQRLIINSLMGDGEFARIHFDQVWSGPGQLFEGSFKFASKAGHLIAGITPKNAFWFMIHVATKLGHTHLPKEPAVTYAGTEDTIIREAVTFILRGFGMKESVIEKMYDAKALKRLLASDEAAATKVI